MESDLSNLSDAANGLELNFPVGYTSLPDSVESPVLVLLVDDEPRILSSLNELLKGRGYLLTSAANGGDAIQHLRRGPFDLVILDLHLPDIGGHEIMDFMNQQKTGCNVIVTSGARGIDAVIGALKRGAYDYLRKPYSREELLKAVDNALQQRRLKAENQRIALRLERSERIYRYLVDSSPDIIYTLDHEGRFTFVNDRAHQLLGFSRDEILGKHFSVLVHEDDLDRAHYVFKECRDDHRLSRNVELRLKSRHTANDQRTFSHELTNITFGSTEDLQNSELDRQKAFWGTYGVARDITERKRADELINYQAFHDILTQLPNRALFRDRLGLALLQAKRNESNLAVMFLDLDRFKIVNDTLGHGVGDELLQQVSSRLKACLRRCDTLSRLGGDEFLVVLCLLYTSPSPRDGLLSRMPSSA